MTNDEHKLWTAPGPRSCKTAPVAVYIYTSRFVFAISDGFVGGSIFEMTPELPKQLIFSWNQEIVQSTNEF